MKLAAWAGFSSQLVWLMLKEIPVTQSCHSVPVDVIHSLDFTTLQRNQTLDHVNCNLSLTQSSPNENTAKQEADTERVSEFPAILYNSSPNIRINNYAAALSINMVSQYEKREERFINLWGVRKDQWSYGNHLGGLQLIKTSLNTSPGLALMSST